jgi:hypothetical protein
VHPHVAPVARVVTVKRGRLPSTPLAPWLAVNGEPAGRFSGIIPKPIEN